eukprot:4811695-Pyramimonas_sp.AAC.1
MASFSAEDGFWIPRSFIFFLRFSRKSLCDIAPPFALPCTRMARWSHGPSSSCISNCFMVMVLEWFASPPPPDADSPAPLEPGGPPPPGPDGPSPPDGGAEPQDLGLAGCLACHS